MVVGKTKAPKKEERRRMKILKEHVPCVPCLLTDPRHIRLPSIQHTVSGFTRDGHMSTYSACEWHHFAYKFDGMTNQQMYGKLGPSLAHGKRTYQEFFGPEALLVRIATYLVDAHEKWQWPHYNVPAEVKRQARLYWEKKRP